MPSVEDKTFKLKWTLQDYSVCVGERYNWKNWVISDPFPVGALGYTQWRMHMYSPTINGYLVCTFQRDSRAEEYEDISFQFIVTILGKNGLVLYHTEITIYHISPNHQVIIDMLPTQQLKSEHLANDKLVICYEIRQITLNALDDSSSGVWKDELRVLSDDMRKLLESGYQSDIALKSSDGRLIPVHFCVVLARWKELTDAVKKLRRRPRLVVCTHVTGPILAAFVSYLYTGTIPASDVTMQLFEFVVEQFSTARVQFYTLPQEMSMRSIQRKESVAFRWWYEGGVAHFHRVLPLRETAIGEILVDISTVGSHLDVRFSLSKIIKCVYIKCTATLVGHDNRFDKSADHFFDSAYDLWHFPDFIQMSLFTDGFEGIHVEYELSVSTGPDWTFVESTSTEFLTGSREVNHVEMLSSGLRHFFMEQPFSDLCDVKLRTAGGFYRSCKSVLGIRSEVLRKLFLEHPKESRVRLEVKRSDPDTLSSVLEYLYTGWTELGPMRDTFNIYTLALKMSLHGLVRKCEQYASAHVARRLL